MRRRRPAGEPGHREIKRAKKQMHRAALTDKSPSELLHHAIRLNENPPESVRVFAIVCAVRFVEIEADGLRNFVWLFVNRDMEIKTSHFAHQTAVERGYRLRLEREPGHASVTGVNRQLMAKEI